MARGWYGVPLNWREAARRAGALLAMGEIRAARVCEAMARAMWGRGLG